jgi:hypothetical protein
MALFSSLFRGNRALEACAVQDSAHVTRGATGDHVAKIQFALFELDGVAIDRSELVNHQYGRSTAAAVLAYKTKRQIINRSYQSSADDIVGKMTIASLDKEMLARERQPKQPGDCLLSPPGIPILADFSPVAAASTSGRATSLTGAQGRTTAPRNQLSGFIRVLFQITLKSATEDGFPLSANIELARDLLAAHGISLFVEVRQGFADTLQFSERIISNPGEVFDNVEQLRKASEDARPGLPGVLRAIVCQMVASNHGGETFRNRRIGGRVVPPFVVMNSETIDPSRATLLHEMIHASKPGPLPHDPEPHSVFSDLKIQPGSIARTVLKSEHAETLSKLPSKL